MLFNNSQFEKLKEFNELFPTDVIKNEPMFFSSNVDYAYENGGPITKAFLDLIPYRFTLNTAVFDSRVHMLMPGWVPCIPGWHHDDVPRTRPDGQPDYENMSYKSEHVMGLVNGDICPTQFAVGKIDLSIPTTGKVVYEVWNEEIEAAIKNKVLKVKSAGPNDILYFDWQSFHTGSQSIGSGWRWFGRISINTDRKIFNEIRRQVQVYLPRTNKGW